MNTLSNKDIVDVAKNGISAELRDFAPYVTQSLGNVVDRGMSRDPGRRQKSALIFANELSRAKCYRRKFVQITPHSEHVWCALGKLQAKSDIHVCVTRRESLHDIQIKRASGAHIRKHEEHNQQQSHLSSTLRKVFAVL